MWSNLLLGVVAAWGVFVAAKLMSPVDYHLNKPYLQRILQRQSFLTAGESIHALRAKRVPVAVTEDFNLERVFQRVTMDLGGGKAKQIVAQSFYPTAVLFEQRAKQKKSLASELMQYNPYKLEPVAPGMEIPDAVKEDPLKDDMEEAKVRLRNIARLQDEVNQLLCLNKITTVYPRLINFDEKGLLTIVEDVGNSRLDHVLAGLPEPERFQLLESVVRLIAEAHQSGSGKAEGLLPGMHYSASMLQNLLEFSLSLWPKVGVSITEANLQEFKSFITPVLGRLSQTEQGLKLGEAAPRNFYYDGATCRKLDWGMARKDYVYFDLVELICDPVAGLTLAQERMLVDVYRQKREFPDSVLADLTYASLVYRLILSGYIAQYLAYLPQMTERQRGELGGVGWTEDNLQALWSKLAEQTDLCPELHQLSAWYRKVHLPI